MPRSLIVLLLACALAACGLSPDAVSTSVAQTQAAEHAQLTAQAQTATAGAPTATTTATNTMAPTVTATPSPTATPTATATASPTLTPPPSDTPTATATPTALPTHTPARPAATPVPPTSTPPPAPDFVTIALAVRSQIDGIGGQIDYANRSGFIDCEQLVASYDYVVARYTLALPPELAGPYALYQSGLDKFVSYTHVLRDDCASYNADPNKPGAIPNKQGSDARLGITMARDLITQAIVAAGGTP